MNPFGIIEATDDDILIDFNGRLDGKYKVSRLEKEFVDWETMKEAIHKWSEENKKYPRVLYQLGYGGYELCDIILKCPK
jgi:hypothetical protein